MLRRHIVLLIAIRPSDGDVNPGVPLGAIRKEQAMSRHRVSPSHFLSSSSESFVTYASKLISLFVNVNQQPNKMYKIYFQLNYFIYDILAGPNETNFMK